jgi:predicted permease
MSPARLLRRLLNLISRRSADKRLNEEIESHIAIQTEDNIRAGMSAEEAYRHARLKFGSIDVMRQFYYSEQSLPFLENLLLDLRYALRVLRKSPAFTIVAIVTLMLGIGANVVVFGVLNAVVLQPLNVSNPESLYQLRNQRWIIGHLLTTSYPTFEDFRQRNTTFSGMAAIDAYSNGSLSWHNMAIYISGDEVTGNYFDLLGVQPKAGQLFHESAEHGPNSAPYIVLSDSLWRSAFHADTGVIGTTVEFNKHPFTVIGVAAATFHGTERFVWPDYWIPMMNEQQANGWDYLHDRAHVSVMVIGRLKPGVTEQQATENLSAISAGLAREFPETDDGQAIRLIHPGLFGDVGNVIRDFIWSIAFLALLVLFAACANLASLFAARAADRSRELALRMALGSSRRQLASQLLTEAAVLSLIGGSAGFATANLLLQALNRWRFGGHLALTVDARVYLAGLAFTLASALLFGMLPARQAWQSSPLQVIKGGAMDSLHLRRFALRDLLLGVQIAICTLLVTSSFVAVRSMLHTLHTPLGFKPQEAMLVQMDLSEVADNDDVIISKEKEIINAIHNIPGVSAVGTVSRTPMTGGLHGIPIFSPGTTEFTLNNSALAPYVFSMSPGYLEAAGTRLLDGRDVSWHDTANTPYVAIVNQIFAQKMWGQEPAMGQRFILSGHLTEVVGIAEDGKYHDITEAPQPVIYVPALQSGQTETIFVVRSQRRRDEMTSALERTLSSLAPNVPITVQDWADSLQGELFPARVATITLGVMGLLAAMLAVTGIFGMAAYSVSRRMKELGIRAAVGARKPQIMSAALGRPMVLLGAGSVVGLLAAILSNRLLQHIVYRPNSQDPIVLGGTIFTMLLLGIAATAIPARRALAVDPSKLMRED